MDMPFTYLEKHCIYFQYTIKLKILFNNHVTISPTLLYTRDYIFFLCSSFRALTPSPQIL